MRHSRLTTCVLLLCIAAFAAAVWGSVDCGMRLSAPSEEAESLRLRRLIYFHFALAQAAAVSGVVCLYLLRRSRKRSCLIVCYNERGMCLNPPGVNLPEGKVYRCNLRNPNPADLPDASAAPVSVYPMFMLSGHSSGTKLEQVLNAAYAQRGISEPRLVYHPVLGASPWLAKAAARLIRLHLKDDTSTGVLVVAHGSRLPETPPEPALFCRRLREMLPGTEIAVGYFGQQPEAADVLAGMQAEHVLLLPFLLTEGLHTERDLPGAEQAAACGKTITRLPVAADLLSAES